MFLYRLLAPFILVLCCVAKVRVVVCLLYIYIVLVLHNLHDL